MASLLPFSGTISEEKCDEGDEEGSGSGDKKGKNGGSNQNTSKAVTVERAIEYIRALKQELEETRSKLEQVEGKIKGTEEEVPRGSSAQVSVHNTDNNEESSLAAVSIADESEDDSEVVMLD